MSGDRKLNGLPIVLVVDDEPQIHRFLRPTLEASGYNVMSAASGAEALRLASQAPPSLVLLDLGLPDMDGHQVLEKLRAVSQVPVIVLSAREQAEEKIRALDAGANDYVEKPFDMGELLARARAALRSASADGIPTRVFRNPPLEIDLGRREVRVGDQPVTLTPREYDLLAFLARKPGRVFTHRQLLSELWGASHTADVQYLRVYIGHLRQKLGPQAAEKLMTESGVGYRLAENAG